MVKTLVQRALGETARTRPSSSARRKRCRLNVELLEARCLLSSDPFRSITGVGNNVANPNLGAAGADLIRIAPAAYGDGLNAPAGASRPGARLISNTVSDQTDPANPAAVHGVKLLPDMQRGDDRYLVPGERDFFALLAAH